ncbi:MAG: protein kinase [Anaeromyxobacter sp.]|nr:protein kinase [Anaeromyxobacter sp.]MBL0277520.1 protein kinase [Anaeromyxobacter sp.]
MATDDDATTPPGPGVRPSALSRLLGELAAVPDAADAWKALLSAGQRIGRFELRRELGRGGFGVVWEAQDTELLRLVAFKVVRPGRASHGGARLLREAEAVARLQHPNLVTLYDAGTCDSGPYLVLELLRGQTLAERLAAGPVALPEAVRIAAEVARGLAHAHDEGVIHRDLKPSNVFLCEGGAVKVLDFGMAHAFGWQRAAGGTPACMAPEQWHGAPEDQRTDLFALGVLLHELLSGELPFGEDGAACRAGRAAPALPVPAAPGLGDLVGRLLAQDPADRPRRAAEVVALLEAERRLLAPGDTSLTVALPVPRRPPRRLAALTALGVAVGLLVGAGLTWWGGAGARPAGAGPPSVAVLPFDSLSTSPDDQVFAEGIHGELITQLARLPGLKVIARGSVLGFRGGGRDLAAIAGALGVTALVEGTVQRAGQRVRVQAHLVDPRTGQERWAERYDRDAGDVFAIQTEVALEIARTLGAALTARERDDLSRPPSRDAQALELYRRGLYTWQRSVGVEADNTQAGELFQKALARDPAFAVAHAQLAILLAEDRKDCPGARRHADRARALEARLPLAHAALGRVLVDCEDDPAGAVAELRLAVAGAPGDALARNLLGMLLTATGAVEEGLTQLTAALDLDPRSFYVAVELARQATFLRRYDLAARGCAQALAAEPGDVHALVSCALLPAWRDGDLTAARRAAALLPRDLPAGGDGAMSLLQLLTFLPEEALLLAEAGRLREPFSSAPFLPRAYVLGAAHATLGHAAEARAAFQAAEVALAARLAQAPGDPLLQVLRARALAGLGRADEALATLRRLQGEVQDEQRRGGVLRFTAEIAAAAGRREEALAALGAVLARPDGLFTAASLRVDPRFAALRGDPAFEALLAGRPALAPRP